MWPSAALVSRHAAETGHGYWCGSRRHFKPAELTQKALEAQKKEGWTFVCVCVPALILSGPFGPRYFIRLKIRIHL